MVFYTGGERGIRSQINFLRKFSATPTHLPKAWLGAAQFLRSDNDYKNGNTLGVESPRKQSSVLALSPLKKIDT